MQYEICEKTYRGKSITARVQKLDNGYLVSVTGGDSSHVGAVSIIGEDQSLQTMSFPSHKENVVSESWAKRLYAVTGLPITVAAGVHYDQLMREEIRELVAKTEELLDEVCVSLQKQDLP